MTLKDINFSIAMYGTTPISQSTYEVGYTGDESSINVNFTVTDEADLAGATAKVHLYFADSSHIVRDLTLTGLVFNYTLVGTENDHAGVVRADIIITKGGAKYTRAGHKFRVDTSLEASAPLVEYVVDTLDTLVDGAEGWLLQAQTDFGTAQGQRADEWVADNDTRDDAFAAAQASRTTTFGASETTRTSTFNTNETGRSNTFTINENAREAAAEANQAQAATNHSTAVADHSTAVADSTLASNDHGTAVTDHSAAVADHSTASADHTASLADQAIVDGLQDQFDAVIANATVDSEVINARQGSATLSENLLSVKQQLEQAEPQLKNTPYIYQAMGMAFDSNDPILVDYDKHASWAYSNVHWDAKINKVVVFYTIKPVHGLTNVRLLMRHMDTDYNFTLPTVIADGRASNLALRSQGSAILNNGDYIVLVSRMNNTTSEQLGCDVYKSTDSGVTWTITEILIGGQPIKGTDGDINGCIVLASGRVITYLKEYGTNIARFLYSDDNGATWAFASWTSGTYYNYSEPAFVELSNGTIICYLRPNGGGLPTDTTPEKAIFTKSINGGLTWSNPVQSASIVDFTQGNGKLLLDKSAGRVEFLYYSRHKKIDNMSSIYQSIASEKDAEADNFGQPNRIMRFNRTDTYDGKIGDGGYVGACFLPDKRVVGFYYTGIKTKANICYFVGKKGSKENVNFTIEEVYGTKTQFADTTTIASKTDTTDIYGTVTNIIPLTADYWGQGNFGSIIGNVETNDETATNRIRLDVYVPIKKYLNYVLINSNATYKVAVRQYDVNNVILSDSGWVDSYSFTPLTNAVSIRTVVKKTDGTNLTVADLSSIAFTINYRTIENQLNAKQNIRTTIYDEGREKSWLTGGWAVGTAVGAGTAVKNADNLQMSLSLADNVPGKQSFITTTSLDATNLSKICATGVLATKTGTCDMDIIVYNKSNPTSHSDGRLAYGAFTTLGLNNMSLDVSALTGSVWIAVAVAKPTAGVASIDAKFYQVWTE